MFFQPWYTQKQNGYILLLGVLFIGAVGLSVVASVLLLGLGSSQTSLALSQSYQARALASACAEEALQQIQSASSFVGTGGLTLGQGTCTYTVTSQGGANRTVNATGLMGTMTRKILITLNQTTPRVNIVSWRDVSTF